MKLNKMAEEKKEKKKKAKKNSFKWLEKMYQAGKDYLINNFAFMKQKIGEKIRDGKKRFRENKKERI